MGEKNIRYRFLFLLLGLSLSNIVQAQFKLNFYVDEYETRCGCIREGCIASTPLTGGGTSYHYTSVKDPATGYWLYEFDLADDPRNLRWHYVHIPATPSICNSPTVGCGFTEGPNIPIYSGPESCGTTYLDIPASTVPGRGVYIKIEFSAPQMTIPTIVGGGRLDNICRNQVTLQTTRWLDETYVWQVSRSVTGPWITFASQTGTNAHRTIINRQILGTALTDTDIEGDQLQIRVRPTGTTSCWFDRASPPPSLTVFQSGAPSSITRVVKDPTCRNGDDGEIEVTSLRNSDGSLFVPSGDLTYSLTSPSNSTYNFLSSQNTGIRINSSMGIPVTAGTWLLSIQGVGLTCSMNTTIVVTEPALMTFQSDPVIQAIVCEGGTGALSVSMNNGSAPYTYTILNPSNPLFPQSITTTANIHTFDHLPPGDYQIRVESCGQTITSTTASLLVPTNVLSLSPLVTTNVSCAGQVDGSIGTTVSLGTPSYSIQLDGGAFTTMTGGTHLYEGLSSGPHEVVVRDANGCTVTGNTSIGTNPAIIGDVLSSDLQAVSCAGGIMGSLVFMRQEE